MSPRILCHHHSINDDERSLIVRKVQHLRKFFDRIHEASVILDAGKSAAEAEILLSGPRLNLRVKDQAGDMRTAFEGALKKAERWLLKAKSKRTTGKRHGHRNVTIRRFPFEEQEDLSTTPENTDGGSEKFLLTEQLETKPMSLGEAHLQMQAREKGMLAFVNSDTEEINILRRSAENHIELVALGAADIHSLDEGPEEVPVEIER